MIYYLFLQYNIYEQIIFTWLRYISGILGLCHVTLSVTSVGAKKKPPSDLRASGGARKLPKMDVSKEKRKKKNLQIFSCWYDFFAVGGGS